MMIPQEKIDEILNASDIIEIIGAVVQLKKRGKDYVGLCPFHSEKTPSFTVSRDKQLYYCFGCSKGGNIITFLQETEKLSYVDALQSLADRSGILIPKSTGTDKKQEENDRLYAAARFAGNTFHNNLQTLPEAAFALEYLSTRGISDLTIKTFGIGYSLNQWDALLNKSKSENIGEDALFRAGLLRARDDGSYYDYFRGRLMFPILSIAGRVVGFGARKIRDDDPVEGKYINSPETAIYNKSRVLFCLSHAKEAIRTDNAVLLVEGYLDAISLFQAGIQNVVASSGTALTTDQLQTLSKYTRCLFLVFDADMAGANATLRGIDLALELDFDVRIVELPSGEDPDSFVRKYGGKEFAALAEKAVSFIDFKSRKLLREESFSTPEQKAEAVRSIVQSIARMGDPLKRSFYIKEVSARYGLYETDLAHEMERWLPKSIQRPRRIEPLLRSSTLKPSDSMTPVKTELTAEEREILELMLLGDLTLVQFIFTHLALSNFTDNRARTIAELVLSEYEEHGGLDLRSIVGSITDPSILSLLTELTARKYEPSKNWGEIKKQIEIGDPRQRAEDAIRRFLEKTIRALMIENMKFMNDAALQGADKNPFQLRHIELLDAEKRIKSPTYFKG
jgi:DNA primase